MLFNQDESKTTYLQIRIRESEKEALKNMAKKHNMSLTTFIKKACNEYVNLLENKEDK